MIPRALGYSLRSAGGSMRSFLLCGVLIIGAGQARAALAQELPGKGLAQHPFLYCGEWQDRGHSEQVMKIIRNGNVEWTYSIPGREEYGDCTRMSNGNIVFSRRLGASEVTPDKKIVWN